MILSKCSDLQLPLSSFTLKGRDFFSRGHQDQDQNIKTDMKKKKEGCGLNCLNREDFFYNS